MIGKPMKTLELHHPVIHLLISNGNKTEALFAQVWTNICTGKNLHGSILHLHGTGF